MNLFLLVIITVREPLMHVICILFLKVKGIKDRIKSYDFIEGIDFQSFTEIVEREIGATKRIEYALSISMAKELSMIENNEREGKLENILSHVRKTSMNFPERSLH